MDVNLGVIGVKMKIKTKKRQKIDPPNFTKTLDHTSVFDSLRVTYQCKNISDMHKQTKKQKR